MKRIIILLCLFFSITCYAQLPDSVKHVEIVSEVADTMFLLNKPDIDKINTAFNRLTYADSLNSVNEKIISSINIENAKLENIISEQKIIINNKDIQISNIQEKNKEVISDLEKQVKRANRKKVIWEVAAGAGVLGTIFALIFKK